MAAYKKLMLNDKSITEQSSDTVENTATQNQVDKFSTDYSANKFNELCNEFESITLDNDVNTVSKDSVMEVSKVSARAKLFLVSSLVVFSLVLFLFIYNFVVINQMQNSINILQENAVYQEAEVSNKAQMVDKLLEDGTISAELADLGFSEGATSGASGVALNSEYDMATETNWFDRLCGFIGSIFGG